ncbi:hypothetical protein GKJPGBOP_08000 [Streptomyces paromomycinus]|uniref:Uncharacterized protein n=1 Tax=Streptomyces paromomycinus TaxID=92743 RepID=A0A401WFT5_STREY|nr:hypothetical protein GKJPGBOP_08000 [Streptomyces paromomycinus]
MSQNTATFQQSVAERQVLCEGSSPGCDAKSFRSRARGVESGVGHFPSSWQGDEWRNIGGSDTPLTSCRPSVGVVVAVRPRQDGAVEAPPSTGDRHATSHRNSWVRVPGSPLRRADENCKLVPGIAPLSLLERTNTGRTEQSSALSPLGGDHLAARPGLGGPVAVPWVDRACLVTGVPGWAVRWASVSRGGIRRSHPGRRLRLRFPAVRRWSRPARSPPTWQGPGRRLHRVPAWGRRGSRACDASSRCLGVSLSRCLGDGRGWVAAGQRGTDRPAPGAGRSFSAAAVRRRRSECVGLDGCQSRQVSFSLIPGPEGTVVLRLAPPSQVTWPVASLRRYLYAIDVPAGSFTSSFQVG